jgi:hypothetical protein
MITNLHIPNYADVAADHRQQQEELASQTLEEAIRHMGGSLAPGAAVQFGAPGALDAPTMASIVRAIADRGWIKVAFFRQVAANPLVPGELPELFLTFTAPPL